MVTGVLSKLRLCTNFTRLPDRFNVRSVNIPVGAGPDSNVIDQTVRALANVREVIRSLTVKVYVAFKFPARGWVERCVNISIRYIEILLRNVAVLVLLRC